MRILASSSTTVGHVWFALLSALAFGCGGTTPESTRGLVLASTESVVAEPNGVSVTFPAGSVTVDTMVTIAALPPTRRAAAATPVGRGVELRPAGAIFERGVIVKMPIDTSLLPVGTTLDDVVVVRADHRSDVFVPLPTRRSGSDAVVAVTEHFSDFLPVVVAPGTSTCGDRLCGGTETCITCPLDCGICLGAGACGNLRCEANETCTSCVFDCTCTVPSDAGVDASVFVETYPDIASGVEWLVDLAPGTFDWASAVAYCDALSVNGRDDWHLGSRAEFMTLIDYSLGALAFDTTKINLTGGTYQWTSTPSPSNPASFAYLFGSDGRQNLPNVSGAYGARCARTLGPPARTRAFVDNADGTVTDTLSGLVWQQTVSATAVTQGGAIANCPSLSLGAFSTGWRVPTAGELTALVDETFGVPAYTPLLATGNPTGNYWSSSTSGGNGTAVSFGSGLWVGLPAGATAVTRCVH